MFLHKMLIILKDFKKNAPQASAFTNAAPDQRRYIGEFFSKARRHHKRA